MASIEEVLKKRVEKALKAKDDLYYRPFCDFWGISSN